jgi:hypothetical protein
VRHPLRLDPSLIDAGVIPQLTGDLNRVDAACLPPSLLVAGAMDRAMMDAAERPESCEHRLDVGRRARDDAQDLGGGGLLLQHFSKVLSRVGEFASAYFELPLQVEGVPPSANARSSLRSDRTKLAAARWALCAFERQGHLVTVDRPMLVAPS